MEFKAFDKIEQLKKVFMHITQKIHGTNAQILIYPVYKDGKAPDGGSSEEVSHYDLICGSRNRWIYPGDDNYGFAAHVHAHKGEFIAKLGPGRHYGEWAGLGINSGEGMADKVFLLFDFWRYPPERPLPPKCGTVPLLYSGPLDLAKIEEVMNDLKTNGSKLVPGFMRPEGVVISTMGTRFKKVFQAEEAAWKRPDENYQKIKQTETNDVFEKFGHLFQPIRLEKLLSKDEKYVREFPQSLPRVVNDYFADLIAEGQITGSEGELKGIRKMIGNELFKFCRSFIEEKGQNFDTTEASP